MGTASSGGSASPPQSVKAVVVPAGMRRLTATEYRNTLAALFGSGLTMPSRLDPDDTQETFMSVGAYSITTSPDGVQKYEDAAYSIAQQVLANAALAKATFGFDPMQPGADAASFVREFGRRAWRRPLTDVEVARYVKVIGDVTQSLGTPQAGYEYGLAGLLQSPNFLYMPEVGEVANGYLRFTSYETATRLSYLLTEAPPDADLSAAADGNDLVTLPGLTGQLQRLIALPSTRPTLIGFFGQLLQLDQLNGLTKDATLFPLASSDLFAAMADEANALIAQNALEKRGALLDLLDAKSTYQNPLLAKLYGADTPERGGILTTAAWLSIQAHDNRTSPTYRGVWIRERMLCQEVPPPPPNVVAMLPNVNPNAGPTTTRQLLEQHRKSPSCALCHGFFDPLGFAFENFDAIGAYRTADDGLPVDPSGQLDGKAFGNAHDLVELLKADPRVPDCVVQNLFQFISGHSTLAGQADVVSALAPGFRSSPDFIDLLTKMVTSDWFREPAAPM
jgi:hypothetical protein